jgi:hypothetical protein
MLSVSVGESVKEGEVAAIERLKLVYLQHTKTENATEHH